MKRKLLLILLLISSFGMAQTNNWSNNIASIIYSKCANWHHQGTIGPFNLMSYNDVVAAYRILQDGSF